MQTTRERRVAPVVLVQITGQSIGHCRLTVLLRREGWKVNAKRCKFHRPKLENECEAIVAGLSSKQRCGRI